MARQLSSRSESTRADEVAETDEVKILPAAPDREGGVVEFGSSPERMGSNPLAGHRCSRVSWQPERWWSPSSSCTLSTAPPQTRPRHTTTPIPEHRPAAFLSVSSHHGMEVFVHTLTCVFSSSLPISKPEMTAPMSIITLLSRPVVFSCYYTSITISSRPLSFCSHVFCRVLFCNFM